MKKITILITVMALLSLNSNLFAQWQYNGSNIYFNTGSVGIGTSNPGEAKLHVFSDINNGGLPLRVERTDAANGDWAIQDWLNSSGEVMRVTYSGRLGINTNNPAEKLDVNGKIKSSGTNSALILVSPDGTEWEITIDNSGNLSAMQSTKVLEIDNNNEINVYPNPTENIIKVEFEHQTNQKINVELYDLTSKLIFLKSYSTDDVAVDLNDFNSGIYILKVKDDEGNILSSEKVVKQ